MKEKNEIKDEKLEKVSGGAYFLVDEHVEPTEGDEEQKFINIDGARRG